MTDIQLKNAFRDAIAAEFESFSSVQDYTFSKAFERKMNRLISREQHPLWRFVNTAGKKVAVILLGLLILGLASLSVKAVRTSVVEFITTVFERYFVVSLDGDTKNQIKKRYDILVPDGFQITGCTESEIRIRTEYKNNERKAVILFSQGISDGTQLTIDRETSKSESVDLDGTEISMTKGAKITYAAWTNDGYVFELTCYGAFKDNELFEMIRSVNPRI